MELMWHSIPTVHGGSKDCRPVWNTAVAPLAAFALSTGLAFFAAPAASAAEPISSQMDSNSPQPVFSAASDDLCVPAKPLVVQQGGVARAGDAQVTLASQTQGVDVHANIL